MFLRTAYNYDRDLASTESGLDCTDDPGFAQQSFRDECDINTIVTRFGLTGEMPSDFKMPLSGDFTEVVDFQTAQNLIANARQEFMSLPGNLRARFNNDPAQLIGFLDDEANREEAAKLGVLAKKPEVTRDVVTAVDELAAKLVPKP